MIHIVHHFKAKRPLFRGNRDKGETLSNGDKLANKPNSERRHCSLSEDNQVTHVSALILHSCQSVTGTEFLTSIASRFASLLMVK